MSVYIVCHKYKQGWVNAQSDDFEEMNSTPVLGVWSTKTPALIQSINYNLNYLYTMSLSEATNDIYEDIEVPKYLSTQDVFTIDQLELHYEKVLEKINNRPKLGNKYLEKFSVIKKYIVK